MLSVSAQVEDIFTHITQPISEQVIYKLLSDLRVNSVFKDTIYIDTEATSPSSSVDAANNPTLKSNRLSVEVKHNLNPLNVKWEMGTFNHLRAGGVSLNKDFESVPVFHDPRPRTSLVEQVVPCTVTLDVKMSFTDRVDAGNVINKIFTSFTNGEKFTLTDLSYNYPIHEAQYTTMYGIWKMIPPPDNDQDFLTWMSAFSHGRISTNVNRHSVDSKKQIVASRNVSSAVALIEFDAEQADTNKTNDSTDLYETSFTVTVQFGRVNLTRLIYPMTVYNTEIPSDMLFIDTDDQYEKPESNWIYFNHQNFKRLLGARTVKSNQVKHDLVKVPWYDPWIVPRNNPIEFHDYNPFMSIIFTLDDIDNTDGNTVINLETDLPYLLAPEIINIMKSQGNSTLGDRQIINVAVFADDLMIEPAILSLEDGVTLTIPNRIIRPTYRLVLSEINSSKFEGLISTVRQEVLNRVLLGIRNGELEQDSDFAFNYNPSQPADPDDLPKVLADLGVDITTLDEKYFPSSGEVVESAKTIETNSKGYFNGPVKAARIITYDIVASKQQ